MRKFLIAIISLVLTFVVSLSGLFGCGLTVIDNDRDMAQVVATVNIGGKKDVIYKKDVSVAYVNYGYMYQQYYGYTKKQAIEEIVKTLTNSRVIVQYALQAFDKAEAGSPFENVYKNPAITDKWDFARYLKEDKELIEADYETYKSVNDLLESFVALEEDDKKNEAAPSTKRAVPTNAANAEMTIADKKLYIDKGFDVRSGNRSKAFKSFIDLLDDNGLLGSGFDGKTVESTDYFKKTLEANRENKIISKFEELIQKDARKTITFAKLEEEYLKDKEKQTDLSAAEFAQAISSATVDKPLLYGAYGNYGYVYNLLLGADSVQSALITKNNEDTKLSDIERRELRRDILANTTAKDLRSSWVLSGYDMEYIADTSALANYDATYKGNGATTVKFTGDYTFGADYSLPFQGTVNRLREKTDDESAVYGVADARIFLLDDFISFMDNYVYGGAQSNVSLSSNFESKYTQSVYKKVVSSAAVDGYTQKINELLFAFSTDDGSLNTFKGYAIAPKVDGSDSEQYVAEFAEAARELIKEVDNGENGYIVVATDFGYHIIFFSAVYGGNYNAGTFTEYLDSTGYDKGSKTWQEVYDDMIENWADFEDTDFYMYALANKLSTNIVSKKMTEVQDYILNTYVYGANDKYVKINQDVYADMLA